MIELDGTPNKKRLGANAILGVSLAVARAAAEEVRPAALPLHRRRIAAHVLPVPMMNILNGGKHADNNVHIQEFMVMPFGAPSFAEGLRMGTEVFHALRASASRRSSRPSFGDEGGFAPDLEVERGGDQADPRGDREDRAATRPRREARDRRRLERVLPGRPVHARRPQAELERRWSAYWAGLCERYPIFSIEDGLDQDDWDGWAELTSKRSERACRSSATTCS